MEEETEEEINDYRKDRREFVKKWGKDSLIDREVMR